MKQITRPNPDCDDGKVWTWREGLKGIVEFAMDCPMCRGTGFLYGQAAEDQIERERADDARSSNE